MNYISGGSGSFILQRGTHNYLCSLRLMSHRESKSSYTTAFLCFIDFEKVFHMVSHGKLWKATIVLWMWVDVYECFCCSRVRSDGETESSVESTLPCTGYVVCGRSLTLPGRSSPTDSTISTPSGGISISNTHSLSLPNLQQHCTDATSFLNDAINTEWVSLMTSMNLGEVGDVEDTSETSRSVMCCCNLNVSSTLWTSKKVAEHLWS